MNRNSMVLMKTLLLSTSQRNIHKYSKDKKKRKKVVGSIVGAVLMYILLMGCTIAVCIGYGRMGMIHAAPEMCALVISALAFIFTILKTNGYLFNFKEYDMLMSLPFKAQTVAACKFLYMYIKSLPWYLSISVAMMIGYGVFAHPPIPVYFLWLVLSFVLPLIPMVVASFLGFLIARIGAGRKGGTAKKLGSFVQTVMIVILTAACFSLRFIIEGLVKSNQISHTLERMSEITGSSSRIYIPAGWFSDAVTGDGLNGLLPALLLAGISIALFAFVFFMVGRSYRSINSALRSRAAAGKYKMSPQKKRSTVFAIAYKEYRKLIGSTAYMTNAAMGEILAVLLGILTLIVGFHKIISIITHDAPLGDTMMHPSIPFIVYFFVGMFATTVCSLSLEGKNYWILQSLPIEKKTICQGKMLFNMMLTVPVMAFTTICICISARVPVTTVVLYLILGFVLCGFSTAWGCVCGIKHLYLDWENEIEAIKQNSGVLIYMIPNLLVTMVLVVGVVIAGVKIDHRLLAIILIAVVSLLALLCYRKVIRMSYSKM